MIIRSQDNETLIVDDVVYEIELSTHKIWCSSLQSISGSKILAKYSTHEKALKVLDMLEQYCSDHSRYTCYDSIYYLTNEVFTFPKDDEVE